MPDELVMISVNPTQNGKELESMSRVFESLPKEYELDHLLSSAAAPLPVGGADTRAGCDAFRGSR